MLSEVSSVSFLPHPIKFSCIYEIMNCKVTEKIMQLETFFFTILKKFICSLVIGFSLIGFCGGFFHPKELNPL